ncbi:MAG: Holliday junction branch migration protein RuvA [Patescibacteria group bacterium]
MIASLKGKITHTDLHFLIIETGGVGYKVFATHKIIARKVVETSLWIYTAVRETALDLYGFETREELAFFEQLLSVPGIGPKSALSVLNAAGLDALKRGISMGDTTHLTKVSGIGKKSAEKIILTLKDKVEKATGGKQEMRNEVDALETLTTLGYREREAREALQKVTTQTDTAGKVKEALKILSRSVE